MVFLPRRVVCPKCGIFHGDEGQAMKLCRAADVLPDRAATWFRESRAASILRVFVYGALLIVPAVIGWQTARPILMWSFVVLSVLFLPLLLRDAAAHFRPTNWV